MTDDEATQAIPDALAFVTEFIHTPGQASHSLDDAFHRLAEHSNVEVCTAFLAIVTSLVDQLAHTLGESSQAVWQTHTAAHALVQSGALDD